ncbi:nuclease-related domain-containing DEAD/DEAH box helicase [Aeromicrobium halocynthiae]
MAPLTWPQEPSFVTRSEQRVWKALVDQLGERDLVIANQRFTHRGNDHELDFAVVLDGHGVVVLEVKGNKIWHEGGQWWQAWNPQPRRIRPVDQARDNKYVLLDWVEASPSWFGRTRARWAHAIVLTDTEIDPKFATPDCERSMIIDTNDLADIGNRLRTLLDIQDNARRPTDLSDAEAIFDALSGRFLPQRNSQLSIEASVAQRDDLVERLSAEQARILDVAGQLSRVEVRGGAGSGKTWLAVEQARRLSRAGKRVALICYSRGLSQWMQRRVSTFGPDERPAYVGTFHGIGRAWGAPDGSDDDSRFWEVELPELMLELASDQPLENLYDAIVIDEAQDFADLWWPVVMEALKYEDDALYVFSDEGQRVFSRFGGPPAGLVPLVLDKNLRNTRQISSAFSSMAPNRMRVSEHDGPDVRFVPCSYDAALDHADDVVESLLEEGWQPSDLALIATGSRHPEQKARQEDGWEAYWDSFWDRDQVFYGSVLGFKGLERPAVVLALNEKPGMNRAVERLYTGLSRARDLLVVVGDPHHIETVGGADVLSRILGES